MEVAYGQEYLVWYRLENDESIFDVLDHCGLPLEKIWDYPNNKELKEHRKSPFWIEAGDEIRAPQKEIKVRTEKSKELYRYQTTNKRIPIIAVYLGFMDEEVNARLAKLIEIENNKDKGGQKEARPVILIERGKVGIGKPILEWHLGNYPIKNQPIKKIIHVSTQGAMDVLEPGKESREVKLDVEVEEKDRQGEKNNGEADAGKIQAKYKESAAPEDILAQVMAVYMQQDLPQDLDWLARGLKAKRYFDVLKLLQHRRITKEEDDKTESRTKSKLPDDARGKGPWLSVVRFGVGRNENAPIIVIRTPEMGLQPSLMSPYIAFLFKAISGMSSQLAHERGHKWEWPLRVSMFGAQGSTTTVSPPGTTATVVASLLVGVEVASDITVTAQDQHNVKLEATFEHSKDSTDGAPHWEATDADTRYVTWSKKDGKVDEKEYHKYKVVKFKTEHRGYAVICLCTPAGSYDFLRITVNEFRTEDKYRDWRNLLHCEYAQERGNACMRRADFCKQNNWSNLEKDYNNLRKGWEKLRSSWHKMLPKEFQNSFERSQPAEHECAESEASGPEQIEDVLDLGWAGDVLDDDLLSPMKTIERAEDLAAWMFRKHCDLLTITDDGRKLDKKSPFYEKEKGIGENQENKGLQDVIKAIKNAYEDSFFYKEQDQKGVITLTVSYFGGDEDKAAADNLGIEGVAMEDYHVLKVLRSAITKGVSEQSDYPIILGWRIDRINCDPKALPPNIVEVFKAYANDYKQSALRLETYVKVIIWGLRGVLKDDIENNENLREAVRWKLPDKIKEGWDKYFWSFAPSGAGQWIPDPFCIEIATDFVNELSKMEPGIAGFEAEKDKNNLKTLAKAVLEAWKNDRDKKTWKDVYDSKGTAEAARKLLKALAERWKQGKDNNNNPLLKTWLRPGKWKNITQATLQDAADEFGGAAIDRAFYKSSNMMALQTMADWFLWEGGEKPIPRTER